MISALALRVHSAPRLEVFALAVAKIALAVARAALGIQTLRARADIMQSQALFITCPPLCYTSRIE